MQLSASPLSSDPNLAALLLCGLSATPTPNAETSLPGAGGGSLDGFAQLLDDAGPAVVAADTGMADAKLNFAGFDFAPGAEGEVLAAIRRPFAPTVPAVAVFGAPAAVTPTPQSATAAPVTAGGEENLPASKAADRDRDGVSVKGASRSTRTSSDGPAKAKNSAFAPFITDEAAPSVITALELSPAAPVLPSAPVLTETPVEQFAPERAVVDQTTAKPRSPFDGALSAGAAPLPSREARGPASKSGAEGEAYTTLETPANAPAAVRSVGAESRVALGDNDTFGSAPAFAAQRTATSSPILPLPPRPAFEDGAASPRLPVDTANQALVEPLVTESTSMVAAGAAPELPLPIAGATQLRASASYPRIRHVSTGAFGVTAEPAKNAAGYFENRPEREDGARASAISFLTTEAEPLASHPASVGTGVANFGDAMPVSSSLLESPLRAPEAMPLPGMAAAASESFMPVDAPSESQAATAAHRAVEAVLHAAHRQSDGEQHTVRLQFSVNGADLSVHVEMRADEVRTTFATDSVELQAALSHEWQAASAAGSERGVRLAAPVFAGSGFSASGGFGDPSASRGRDQDARRAAPGFSVNAARSAGARASFFDTASAVAPTSRAPLGTALHLHSLA